MLRHKSFRKVFMLRQVLIPLSTIAWCYHEDRTKYRYLDVYIFGFRVARFQRD